MQNGFGFIYGSHKDRIVHVDGVFGTIYDILW